MRYHDTGTRDPENALATWLEKNVTAEISELRIQSGYFRVNALGAISAALQRAAELNLKTHFVFGANDGDTLYSDVVLLMSRMGIPRSEAKLSIVCYANALFHPKVYHVKRVDGTQAAFVGSANFTSAGLTGGNVEAAISLDTYGNEDPTALLDEIANAIDKWVTVPDVPGAKLLQGIADANALLDMGILTATRPSRPSRSGTRGSERSPSPTRQKLVVLPAWPDEEEQADDTDTVSGAAEIDVGTGATPMPSSEDIASSENIDAAGGPARVPAAVPPVSTPTIEEAGGHIAPRLNTQAVENRLGFPDYILFAPDAQEPTTGAGVLSGFLLPEGSTGLILKLNRDNGRHFHGGRGTANISIPTASVKTFRFGLYRGDFARPRAEFRLRLRYYSEMLVVEGRVANSNLMPYGFLQGETGHGDVRMLMPAAVKGIADEVRVQGGRIPQEGDIYLLEWPSENDDTFGLTFLAPDNPFTDAARNVYNQAIGDNSLVGGAAWLPPGIAPPWN